MRYAIFSDNKVIYFLMDVPHHVLTIQESGKSGQALSDEAVLEFASAEGRILLTFNRKHFVRLHRQDYDHSGIIACSFDTDFVGLAMRIHAAINEPITDRRPIIRINRPNK